MANQKDAGGIAAKPKAPDVPNSGGGSRSTAAPMAGDVPAEEPSYSGKSVWQSIWDAIRGADYSGIGGETIGGSVREKPAAAESTPASTGSGSGNGSYSSVPLTDGNYSRYGGVPLNNTSSGAASDNGSGAATPASTTPPADTKPTVYYTPDYIGGGNYGSGYDPTNSGGGSSGGATPAVDSTGEGTDETPAEEAEPTPTQEERLAQMWAEAGEVTKRLVEGATPEDIGIDRIDKIDTTELENMLAQIKAAQEQQAQGKIDYGVEQGVNDLNRAMEDADPMFQARRNQIAADEQRALDNQVLYSEARGDRGGIGQSQYASIQNTAAVNQYKVSQEQTKLATDTARQIADLRAQGEFEKADALLDITQNYLGELMNLKRYAIDTNMGVDEFNTKLAQWEAEYDLAARQYMSNLEMSAANLTGAFANGTPTLSAQKYIQEQLANAGLVMMQMGLEPTDSQIEAMGWTKDQYAAYKAEQDLKNAAGGGGGYNDGPIYLTDRTADSPTYGQLVEVSPDFYRAYLEGGGT